MAEEQIDKLTIEVESVGGDDKAIADLRKQLEKLGRVDLSNTVRQLGNLQTALGHLSAVDESVKSMLDNMVKLGISASSASSASKPFNDITKSAKQASAEMEKARKEYENWWESALNAKDAADRIYEAQKSSYENHQRADYASWWESQFRKADKLEAKQAAGDWFDQHAGSKNYYEEMAKGSFDLDESFVPLKTILSRIKEEFFGVGESAKEAGKKAEKALSKTDAAAKKAHKSTSKLGDAFIRIVRFKIVAATMQAVIQAAKEGTTALGEFDAEFKSTLNTYEAAGKAISGGLGLALAPALEAAAPLVEYIADGIGSIGNGISAIVAMLKGDDYYNAVKPVEQIKKEMAEAEEKAEKVRKLISGFDELNIFSSDKEDSKINPFEKIYFDTSEGNSAFKDDLKTLLEFITAATAVAAIVALLKSAFSDKNKTLKEQTDLTKEDIKETVKLGDKVKEAIPSVEGVTSVIGGLNGVLGWLPTPAKGAGDALDDLGKKKPAPVVDTEPLLNGIGIMGDKVLEFVKAEYPGIVLGADDRKLLDDLKVLTDEVDDFANGFSPVFEAEFDKIKTGYSGLMFGMGDMTKLTGGEIGVEFKKVFGDVELAWAETLGAMLDLALTAFDNVELLWDSAIGDMAASWGKFQSGLVVPPAPAKVPDAAPKTETNTNANTVNSGIVMPGKSAVNIDYIVPQKPTVPKVETNTNANTVAEDVSFRQKVSDAVMNAKEAIGKKALEVVAGMVHPEGILAGAKETLEKIAEPVVKLLDAAKETMRKAPSKLPIMGGVSAGFRASGGLVTSGEFFVARENGIPEYIGSFGSQTGVANNEQIVSGISGGVEAVLAAYVPQIIRAIEENATAVNIGDDQIYRSAQRGAVRHRQITGQPAFW